MRHIIDEESNDWKKEIISTLGLPPGRINWKKITKAMAKKAMGQSHGMPKAIYDKLRQIELHGPNTIKENENIKESTKFVIDNKQLQDAFPELYKAYRSEYDSQRPKINVSAEEDYHFSAPIQDSLSDYFINDVTYLFNKGRVIRFDSSDESPANHELAAKLKGNYHLDPGDGVLECHTGYAKYCTLVVHPSFINQQVLPDNSSKDLSSAEQFALVLIASYISAARFKNFKSPFTWEKDVSVEGWKHDEKDLKQDIITYTPKKNYQEAWENICKSLAAKGYVKISSNGAVTITLNGKNKSISLRGR